jgi:hypothetical protein
MDQVTTLVRDPYWAMVVEACAPEVLDAREAAGLIVQPAV